AKKSRSAFGVATASMASGMTEPLPLFRSDRFDMRSPFNGAAALLQPFSDAWRHRELVRAILSRELAVRFRTSIFGWLLAVLAPLVMLALYTLVFSGALKIGGEQAGRGRFDYAFSIFVGLIVFNFFAEIAYRAPLLLAEHKHIIRRSIF